MAGNSTSVLPPPPPQIDAALHWLFGAGWWVWLAIAIGIAALYIMKISKKQVVKDESDSAAMPTADEYAQGNGDDEPSFPAPPRPNPASPRFVAPPQFDGDGHSIDMEERLVQALASSPWTIKPGSEMALTREGNKWKIKSDKIEFVIPKAPDVPAPKEPQPPHHELSDLEAVTPNSDRPQVPPEQEDE